MTTKDSSDGNGQMASQEQLRKHKDQAENPANDSMRPQDISPKREQGNDTAKTPQDRPTGKLEGNGTTSKKSPTSKLESNAKTADHPTAADNKRKHRPPIAMNNKYKKRESSRQATLRAQNPRQDSGTTARSPRALTNARTHREATQL